VKKEGEERGGRRRGKKEGEEGGGDLLGGCEGKPVITVCSKGSRNPNMYGPAARILVA
jgi:hypothetical protein